MSDLRIQYNEEMVGAGHPTKSDTLNRLMLAEHNHDGTHQQQARGFRTGLAPAYHDGDTLTFNGGVLEIDGKLYSLSAATGVTFASLAADTSYWVYVTPPATGNTLAAGDFSASTTAPTYSDSKHGWYNGSARCIFGFITNGSGNIPAFRYSRGRVIYDGDILAASITPSNVWTDVTLSIPAGISLMATAMIWNIYVDTQAYVLLRPKGSATNRFATNYTEANGQRTDAAQEIFTDTNGRIQARFNVATAGNIINIYTHGYQLPEDM